MVWDNAGWHKSSTLLAQTEKGKPLERVQFINLPPYSPRGSAKSVVGGLMSGVVGVLARVRRGPAGTMGSA